jgi:hypothetical protein
VHRFIRITGSLFAASIALLTACAADEGGSNTSSSAGEGGSSAPASPTATAGTPSAGAAAAPTASAGASAAGAPGAGAGGDGTGASTGAAGIAGAAGTPATAGAAGAAGTDASMPIAACDRACLTDINTAYLDALIARDASLLSLADGVRFTENGQELPLTKGLWAVAKALRAFRQDFAEVQAGQTAGFAALDDDDGVVLHAFRLKVVAQQVTEIETIVVRQGEATFFAPSNLDMRDPLYDTEVPLASRLPRDGMIEVVDTYFQGIESGDGSAISVDASAARNENGTVTARGNAIQNLAMFSYIETVKRRYVLVDEERGNVVPFVIFEIPNGLGGSRTLHMVELFKVADGKIMDILAIMVNQPFGSTSGWE